MTVQDVTPALRRKGVESIRYWHAFDCYSVVLKDGRLGKGATLNEAITAARQPDAENVFKVAA